MKPFPAILQERFPCPSGRFPSRPWWRHGPSDRAAIRQDNAYVVGADIESVIQRYDKNNPLPYPGTRTGQIWCNAKGTTKVVSATASQATLDSLSGWFLLYDPICPHLAPWSPSE